MNSELLLNIILCASMALGLMAFCFSSRFDHYEKFIGAYVVLVAIFELVARVWRDVFHINNLPGLHLYTLLEFLIVTMFFFGAYKALKFDFPHKKVLIIGSLLIIGNSLLFQSIYEFNSFSRIGVDMFIIVNCILFFVLILRHSSQKDEYKPAILFVSALLLKSSLASILYLFSNEIMRMEEIMRNQLWTIRLYVNLFTLMILFRAVYLIVSRKKCTHVIGLEDTMAQA